MCPASLSSHFSPSDNSKVYGHPWVVMIVPILSLQLSKEWAGQDDYHVIFAIATGNRCNGENLAAAVDKTCLL